MVQMPLYGGPNEFLGNSLSSSAVRPTRFLATWIVTTGFLASSWSAPYFTYTTRAFMPDLTRSINGWMKSERVLPAVVDRQRRTR